MGNTKSFGNNCLFILQVLTSVLNSNYRCMMFAHEAILWSFMQWVEEDQVALNDFDNTCSLGYKRQIMPKSKDVMNVSRGLKLHDLICLSFHF